MQVSSLKVFIHIQVPIFLNCDLSCKHTNFKESFSKSEIQLKFSDSDTRKSSNISDSWFQLWYLSHHYWKLFHLISTFKDGMIHSFLVTLLANRWFKWAQEKFISLHNSNCIFWSFLKYLQLKLLKFTLRLKK